MKIQCARLEGLDSKEGLLLLGTTHFYVVEGLTLTKNGEIADLENLTIKYEVFCEVVNINLQLMIVNITTPSI